MPVGPPSASASTPPRFRLRTLGGVGLYAVRSGEEPELVLRPGKLFAIAAYLAIAPGHTERRTRLAELLWSNRTREDGREVLRVDLHELRRKLGEGALDATKEQVTLVAPVDSDYAALIAAWERRDAEGVVALYAGDFLPDFALAGGDRFHEWVDVERARLRQIFARAAEDVVRAWLTRGRTRDAIALARRVRDLDRLAQAGWRLLLETLVAGQDPIGATVEADALQRLLADEELDPEPATAELLLTVRAASRGPGDEPSRSDPAVAASLVELVGRERELAAILAAWERARAGRVAHVHVVAPAGLGKTRLLAEAAARLRSMRGRVVHLAARLGTRGLPLAFASDVAGQLGALPGASEISPQAASVLVALNPSLSAAFKGAPDPATGDEALRRRQIALRELIETLAGARPLALLLDDLHWSDPDSRRLLEATLAAVEDARVLVITTARPPGDEPRDAPRTTTLLLEPLSADAIGTLLVSLAPLPDAPWAHGLAAALHDATGGSPLLVLETLELLVERGILTRDAGGWRASDPDALATTLRAGSAIRARLASLDAAPRAALLALAVAGVPVADRLLTPVVGAAGDVATALLTLEQRGLVVRLGSEWTPAHDEYVAAILGAASDAAVRATAVALGRAIADGAGDDVRPLRVAALLLARGDDTATLRRVFRRFVCHARLDGDGRADRTLARDLLGPSASDARADALVRALPWHVRARLVTPRRIVAAAAVVLLTPVSAAAVVFLLAARPQPHLEAALAVEHAAADHAHLDVFEVPLDAATLASSAPLDVDVSRRPRWRLPDSVLRFRQAGWAPRPDGRGWVLARGVRDSGVLDLFDLRVDGGHARDAVARRLTFARSDDLEPDWSPDNTQLVFATARWAPGYSLAVQDVRTGRARRLTDPGGGSDEGPLWSPDGSRIAFGRRSNGPGMPDVCVVDTDGAHARCVLRGTGATALGWTGPHHLLAVVRSPDGPRLQRVDVETGDAVTVRADAGDTGYTPSPDGRYVLCQCRQRGYPPGALFLFAVDLPNELKPIRLLPAGTPSPPLAWAPTSPRPPFLDTLHLALGPGRPLVGAAYQLRAAGVDSGGHPVDVGVVRWRALDTAVATVDSAGLLHPRRAGHLGIEASAGGWRVARATITVDAPNDRLLLDERWAGGLTATFTTTWRPFGEPRPLLVPSDVVGPAFSQNGDGAFWSGAYTRRAFPVAGGLWAEAVLSVPLTDPRSGQEQMLQLFAVADSAHWATWDHATADFPRTDGCRFDYPRAFVSSRRADSMAVFSTAALRGFGVPRRVRDGQPFRILLQLLPDGRCGVAFDGVPIWVTPPTYFHPDARLMLFGNSQSTRVLVGPLAIHAGLAPHIAWDAPERHPAGRDTSASIERGRPRTKVQ